MPSMECHECNKVARCSAVAQRDGQDKVVLVYLCTPCKRDYLEDLAMTVDEGGEA